MWAKNGQGYIPPLATRMFLPKHQTPKKRKTLSRGQKKLRHVYCRGDHVQSMTEERHIHERNSHTSTVLEPRIKEQKRTPKYLATLQLASQKGERAPRCVGAGCCACRRPDLRGRPRPVMPPNEHLSEPNEIIAWKKPPNSGS